MLQSRARAAKPEDPVNNVKRQPLGPAGGMQGCLGTCTIPCKPPPGLVTDTKADTREVELEMQRIYGAKLPQRQMDCGHHGFGMTCAPDAGQMQQEKPPEESSSGCVDDEGSSAFLKYMENRIKTRPYGLVKEAYEASKSGELTLHVGEIIYLRGKPGFDRYCGEKETGQKEHSHRRTWMSSSTSADLVDNIVHDGSRPQCLLLDWFQNVAVVREDGEGWN